MRAHEFVAENFADGKVRGKSRPGRVKRAGASCKGSVSDLRARAKKYSGERGKMYHWCANMKAGRQKTNEAEVNRLTIGGIEIIVDDHVIERAAQRRVSLNRVDQLIRRIKNVRRHIANIEPGQRFYIWSPEMDLSLGFRRIGTKDRTRLVFKTVWPGKPMDLNIAEIIRV